MKLSCVANRVQPTSVVRATCAPLVLAALLFGSNANVTWASRLDFPELAPLLAEAAPESTLSLVPPRTAEEIALDQADAESRARASDETIVLARGLSARAQAQVEVKKTEVDNMKARAKAAKEAKNEAEQKDCERQQKELEIAQKRLERIRDMRGAEIDLAEAQKAAAKASAQLHQAEKTLLDARTELTLLGSSAPSASQLEKFLAQKREVAKAETRVLETDKELASRYGDVAGQAKDLADKRLSVLAIDQEIAARKK